jgi:hypothetical protein
MSNKIYSKILNMPDRNIYNFSRTGIKWRKIMAEEEEDTEIRDQKNNKMRNFLYCVDRASRHKFLLITNLMKFLMYLFIHFISLHVSSIKCSSSGDRIVLIHRLVSLVCVSDCLVCPSLWTGIPSSHLHRLIIPDDVLIQFDLLMMSAMTFETCRDMK